VRSGSLTQVGRGVITSGALWFGNAGQARCVFVRSGRVRQVGQRVVSNGLVRQGDAGKFSRV
jgi:hypothetical protein